MKKIGKFGLLLFVVLLFTSCAKTSLKETNLSSSSESSQFESEETSPSSESFPFSVSKREAKYTDDFSKIILPGIGQPNTFIKIFEVSGERKKLVKETGANENGEFDLIFDAPEKEQEYYLTNGDNKMFITLSSGAEMKEQSEKKAAEENNQSATTIQSQEAVSREFQNALGSARDYLNSSSFSKQGLYDQLLYEEFPEDAAQFAVDNITADWNANALQKAKDYLDFSSFSDQGLYDQLIYEGFTAEQAQFAIDNLPK